MYSADRQDQYKCEALFSVETGKQHMAHTGIHVKESGGFCCSTCKWLRAVILRGECHYTAQIPSQQIPLQQRCLYNKNPFKLWLAAHVLQAIFDVRFGVHSNGN